MNRVSLIAVFVLLHFGFRQELFGQHAQEDSMITKSEDREVKLILKNEPDRYLRGHIVEFKREGVVFNRKRIGPFYQPKAELYLYQDIESLTTGDGEILFQAEPEVSEKQWGTSQEAAKPQIQKARSDSIGRFISDLRFSMAVGYSRRAQDLEAGTEEALRNYAALFETGINFSADLIYFFSERYGVGARFGQFTSQGELRNATLFDENGASIGVGTIMQDMNIIFWGPGLFYRDTIKPRRIYVMAGLSFGRIVYQDNATVLGFPVEIKGSSHGFSGVVGIDFMLMDVLAIGIDVSTLVGQISNHQVNGERDPSGFSENMGKTDLNIGLKFYY